MSSNLKRLLAAVVLLLLPGFPAAAGQGLTVVELFTSQACSSCPPADKFLGELARRADIIALSFHVDYWDYTGWKDSFASSANSQRQRLYAKRLKLRFVYTPQMVIQGVGQATGSDRAAVLVGIDRQHDQEHLKVNLHNQNGMLIVTIAGIPKSASGAAEAADILLAAYDKEHEIPIRKGENQGRTLKYFNVVRSFEKIGAWNGEAMEIIIPLQPLIEAKNDGCAVIIQSRQTGKILGAARMALR